MSPGKYTQFLSLGRGRENPRPIMIPLVKARDSAAFIRSGRGGINMETNSFRGAVVTR